MTSPRPFEEIPGPRGLPIIGMAAHFLRDPFQYVQAIRQHGPIVRVQIGSHRLVYLLDPELVGEVLLHRARNHTKGRFLERSKVLFGLGLVTSEGELWRRQRRLMAPAFHPRAIHGFAEPMLGLIAARIAALPAGELRAAEVMNALTLELALQMLFGTTAGEDGTRIADAFTAMSRFFSSAEELLLPSPMWVPTPGHLRFQAAYRELEAVVSRIIAERRERGSAGSPDLLDRLLEVRGEDGAPMSDEQLHDEVRTLVLAAHETTAIGLACTLYLLATHPEAQERVAAEVLALGRPVQAGDALPAVDAAFKEGIRLFPPVPIVFREPAEDEVLGGFHIPAGTTLGLTPWAIQRDERWFPEPDAFRPERWTPEMEAGLHRFAFFPFGGGPRVCIGAAMAMTEARLVLAELLRRFRVEATPRTELALFPAITLRPTKPLLLHLSPRQAGQAGMAP